MDIQIKTNHQQQLANLLIKNQQLYANRSNELFAKLEVLMNEGGELQFSNSVNLDAALQVFKEIQYTRKQQNSGIWAYQVEVNREYLTDLETQNQTFLSEIADLQREINQFKKSIENCQLAQKYTSKRILSYQQLLINNSLQVCNQNNYKQSSLNYSMSFVYDENKSKAGFKKSYTDLVHHFIAQVEENQLIVSTLSKSIQNGIQEGERVKLKIKKIQEINKQVETNNFEVQEIRKKNEELKVMLRARTKQINALVEQTLPQIVDSELKEIKQQKRGFEAAYHSLLEVLNKVANRDGLEKDFDYINQP